MRYCDLTLAYTETSGGIRTYIDRKRRYVAEQTDDEHVLIVPGEEDRVTREDRLQKIEIQSPQIPGCEPYRFFSRPAKLRRALEESAPEVVELGSYFVTPWVAFHYREARRDRGGRCLVSAYFHTDVAHAYVGAPLRKLLSDRLEDFSETLAHWGERLSEAIESGAESTFGHIFRRCDLTFAATQAQAKRLAEYGVEGTGIIPLGVDLEQFSPDHRSHSWRRQLGVGDADCLLLYCGRLDSEKAVMVVVDAYAHLAVESAPGAPRFHLALMGEGPLREELEERARALPRMHVLPYERERQSYARALASADIYVTAGPFETFGLAVIEAQASALPCVGVDSGALRERVAPDRGRLGPVDDSEAMAENIRAVRRQQAAMAKAARAHVLAAGYRWDDSFRRLFAAYASHAQPAAGAAGLAQ